jgi:hypothetical protein
MKRAVMFALLAIACLAASLPGAAAPLDGADVPARIAAAPVPAAGEDGLVVYEAHQYRYVDGLMSHRHQRLLRVTTEWALERLADPRLRFDSARQKIVVHAARTYFNGGGFIDSPANAFNTVTPGELALAPDFLDIQELVITHIGLEPGCVLWLDTEKIDTAPAGLPEGALLFPQGEFPVLEMDAIAEGLYAELVNPEGGLLALPAGTSEGLRHAWHFENLPAAPGQATYRLGDQLPHLNFSPLESWDLVFKAIEASLESALADTAGLGDWLAGIEQELGRPYLGDRDFLDCIGAKLNERTRLLDGPDWAWCAPRSVARILETSTATPLERTALMFAACRGRLRRLELPARWEGRGDLVLPLAALATPWLSIHGDDGILYFSPSEGRILGPFEEMAPRVYSETMMLPRWTPADESEAMKVTSRGHWNLTDGTFALVMKFEPGDLGEGTATPETTLREWCESWTDSSQVSELALYALGETGFEATLKGKAPIPNKDEAGRIRLSLPRPPLDLDMLLPPGMNRAQSDCRALLFPPRQVDLQIRWLVDLPDDFDALLPPSIDLKLPDSSFRTSQDIRQEYDVRRVWYDFRLHMGGASVSPADYPAFRALVNAALDPKTTEVLLVPRAKD